MIKEACIENLMQALRAQEAGASRVELCGNLDAGGITPSYEIIQECMKQLTIPTFVMIRPRSGNFIYSGKELELMKSDIDTCKQLGVPAVVFGLLTATGRIDEKNTRELIKRARPMQVTFHKAFDELKDPYEGLKVLTRLGVERVLTSGTKATAEEGTAVLNQLIEKANGRIIIIAAGKVTKENLSVLSGNIHTNEFHGKKII